MTKLTTPGAVDRYVNQVANHRGWVVNPDQALVNPIIEGLARQASRLGKPFCPCRDADGGDADKDIVCPCAYAEADVQAWGQCFCGLFLQKSKDPATVCSIPERRP